ncbi:MAG: CRISPR repeat RNA endoribonuclease Cas6 [Candidatus Ozemobacter sibiricus]|jgi:hypothetical protein|uniref:CRISPR repeat RNA endoribonuclease Cas6 n=1 Tax=Candidatus Ozemobacter sibiricus TaxID=2268124 RepID=A0A367ZJF3_9BACT|nr:MAG: CRISPR repeat RNA endoribonuclease Cas6 [Candidatus Ozemobacter sibiricus]
MHILPMTITYTARGEGRLPPFKPPLLRGALGRALVRIGCRRRQPPCDDCPYRQGCLYFGLYVAFQDETPRFGNMRMPPHPYVIRCDNDQTAFQPGERLDFEMVLIGRASGWAPAIAVALAEAGERGFGAGRHPFRLDEITLQTAAGPVALYADGALRRATIDDLTLPDLTPLPLLKEERASHGAVGAEANGGRQSVRVVLHTPTRWANRVDARTPLEARAFLKSVLRRVSSLSAFWADDEWREVPFGEVLGTLEATTVAAPDLRWESLSRYSLSQGTKIPLEGWVGTFLLRQIPARFSAFVGLAQPLHLGKGSVFGLGRYSWHPLEETPA